MTGDFPEDIQKGILVPMQKPGKKRGPLDNLRPVILLTFIRKILAGCLLGRVSNRILQQVPLSQAAFQSGRSTTEQVLAIKILIERAITSTSDEAHILLLDMSKAFDTVDRNRLIREMGNILEPDELFLAAMLVSDMKLRVRCDKELSIPFHTNTGIPQGDSNSPVDFILYLAEALGNKTYLGNFPQAYCLELQYADDVILVKGSKDQSTMSSDRYRTS